ncbi:hypothetical protein EYF80_016621 [Liparis tanakae]|uniref:Uncharacterized protein n=1 Tax=Liparis tanakae TaxID=230148 RepID=A0A4Z2I6Q5_9TELE|nr:hypothetical protein EYF80_016621 [Liparis tanakae]
MKRRRALLPPAGLERNTRRTNETLDTRVKGQRPRNSSYMSRECPEDSSLFWLSGSPLVGVR